MSNNDGSPGDTTEKKKTKEQNKNNLIDYKDKGRFLGDLFQVEKVVKFGVNDPFSKKFKRLRRTSKHVDSRVLQKVARHTAKLRALSSSVQVSKDQKVLSLTNEALLGT